MTRPFLPVFLALSILLSGCLSAPAPATPTLPPAATEMPTPLPATDQEILALPAAFRYQVVLRPAAAPDEPLTVITGQYREGALAQLTRHGEDVPEELVMVGDGPGGALRSYTRAEPDPTWIRWPGAGFDAGWGLASPFSVLRLYPLADETAAGEPDAITGVPEPTTKIQAFFSAATIERLLRASVSAVATQPEAREALETQLQPLLTPHTVTYWVGESGRIYQAAATLLTVGPDGEPAPWLEVIWRYWGYDDPTIAVTAPTEAVDVSALAAAAPTIAPGPTLDPTTTLLVRVFAVPGMLASDVKVTVYPTGSQQTVAAQAMAEAQFALPEGLYEALVQAGDVEELLGGIEVMAGSVTSRDVVLGLGTLTVTVTQGGATPEVDIMVYPAGDRQNPAGWRTENPANFTLRAGAYDVEVALPDLRGTRIFPGLTVQPGETIATTLDIGQ